MRLDDQRTHMARGTRHAHRKLALAASEEVMGVLGKGTTLGTIFLCDEIIGRCQGEWWSWLFRNERR